MKILRVAIFALASLALLSPAWSDVRTVQPVQTLARPANQTFSLFGHGVAIDGGHLIVLIIYDGGQSALLYRRNSSNGQWVLRRTLLAVTGPFRNARVHMRNGIAAVQFGDRVWIFEHSGGDYLLGRSAAPIRHPGGMAISGNSILIGGNDCDYDGVVYQKGANGLWGITGRMDDNQGECRPEGLNAELSYDYAILNATSAQQANAWRRNGTALEWLPAGSLDVSSSEHSFSSEPFRLQGATAVSPGTSLVFRRSGTSSWTGQGSLMAVDYALGTGTSFTGVYRDGVLLTSESWLNFAHARPYAYLEVSPGRFEHVAILETRYSTDALAISGRTVAVVTRDWNNSRDIEIFTLPAPLAVPPPIVNDFEDRDISEFTSHGGQFSLATRGTDDVLTRTDTSGLGLALLEESDWTHYQRIEADIATTFNGTGSWVGLVARYVDADNYYYVAIRPDTTFGIYRRLEGTETLLREGFTQTTMPIRVTFAVYGDDIYLLFDDRYAEGVTDRTLRHGRAGIATFQARADFDDVNVSAAETISVMEKDWLAYGYDVGRPFTELGGDWQLVEDEWGTILGLFQLDPSGSAVAVAGAPVENQEIIAVARVNSFGSSAQGAWLGLLARYVDERTHYYVTVRSTGQIQIRKQVNGVVTVLASTSFTAVLGRDYHFRLLVIDDQLQLFVDRTLVLGAHDDEIQRGQYGVATYRATGTWQSFSVLQP